MEYLAKIGLTIQTVNHGQTLDCGGYVIKAIHTSHDENIGAQLYLIKQNNKSLLYATDTSQISDIALKELAGEKIDCIFLDESFGIRDYMFSHLNIQGFDQYIKALRDNRLLNENCLIYATHITHDGNPLHNELEQILDKYGYKVAYDGMEILL